MGRNPRVDAFLQKKKHPLTAEIQMVREIIINTDERIEEDIKWQAPTFIYKGNMASIYMNARKFVQLQFQKGVVFQDGTGLLESNGNETRVARFMNAEDIQKKREALETVTQQWIRMRDEI
jgi:uncharacterized protein YdeI (YjbR/CyaY-like superfamily)